MNQRINFSRIFLYCIVFLISSELPAAEPITKIQIVTDLQQLGIEAEPKNLPIILVYSALECDHCERLEAEVLNPLIISGELNNIALMRKIVIDGVESIRRFDGKNYDAEDYAFEQNVDVTPTIQFVDVSGKELTPKLIGYQTPSMFMSYIQHAVTESKKSLQVE